MCMLRQFVNLVKNKALGTMMKYTKIDLGLDFFFKLFNNISIVQIPWTIEALFSKMIEDSHHLQTDSLIC